MPPADKTCWVPAPTLATRSSGFPAEFHPFRNTSAASGDVTTTYSHSSFSAAGSLFRSGPSSNSMQGISTVSIPLDLSTDSSFPFFPSSRVNAT
eukprot:3835384-Rhodomonas_salina.1